MMEWTNERTVEFVEDYRTLSCLWDPSHSSYRDRSKRAEAQLWLAGKYQLPSKKAVNNKIKSLRSYFHKIHADVKRRSAGHLGEGMEEPNWFVYKHMLFILDGKEMNVDNESYSSPVSPGYSEIIGDEQNARMLEPLVRTTIKTEKEEEFLGDASNDSSELIADPIVHLAVRPRGKKRVSHDTADSQMRKGPRKCNRYDGNEPFRIAEDGQSSCSNSGGNIPHRDHLTSFAENVELRIRNLVDPRLQSLAQMRIQSVLYEIETGETLPHVFTQSNQVNSNNSLSGNKIFQAPKSNSESPCTLGNNSRNALINTTLNYEQGKN